VTGSPPRDRPSSDGVVSGFVDEASVALLEESIAQASVSALATDLLTFWPPAKPPFVLALFEGRAALDLAAPRLAGMAATGATIVVGAPAKVNKLPAGLYGVDLRGCEDLSDARATVVLEGSFAAALVAVRSEVYLREGGDDGNLYNARWTFRRPRVVDAMQQLLRPLRPVLAAGLLEAADAAIGRAESVVATASESHLLGLLEQLSTRLVTAPVLAPVVAPGEQRPRIVRAES
jgi:hypothetical protein